MPNDTKKRKNSRKRTQYMCAAMLAWLQQDINFKPVDMYTCLGIPRRTYQDYLAGHRGIPADIAAAVWDIYRRNRQLMDNYCSGAAPQPCPTGCSPGELLRKIKDDEYEAGIIRVTKGES